MFDTWLSAVGGGELFPERVSSLIGRLPVVHAEVLQAVMTFLRELIVHGDSNGLSSTFLSSAFGPLLLRPNDPNELEKHRANIAKLVQGILDNFASIFYPSLSRSSDNTTQSTATESTPRKTRKKADHPQLKSELSLDEFAALAKMVKPGGPVVTKTPDDSEEDRPESSSDDDDGEDEEEAPPAQPIIVGRATVRVKAAGNRSSSTDLIAAFKEAPAQEKQSQPPPPPLMVVESPNSSLGDVDTHVLRKHIDELRGMSLSGSSTSERPQDDTEEESSESRKAKIEKVRAMLKADPRFRSHTKTSSAKYEPPAVAVAAGISSSAKRKKTRRKHSKKKLDSPSVTSVLAATPAAAPAAAPAAVAEAGPSLASAAAGAPPAVAGVVDTPKKRRPRICAKCKENVRGTKVRF